MSKLSVFYILMVIITNGSVMSQTSQNVFSKFISQSLNGCGSSGFSNAFCGHSSSEMIFATLENRNPTINNIQNYNIQIENHFGLSHNSCGTGTPQTERLKWLFSFKGYDAQIYGSSSFYNSSQGYSGELDIQDLFALLNQGCYIIVQTYIGMNPGTSASPTGTHWMVLRQIDFSNNKVIVNDPGKSLGNNFEYSLTAFSNNWTATQHPAGSQFTNSKGAPRKRCLVFNPNSSKPIMSNISIYGGSATAPKPFYINILESDFSGNFTHSMLSNFQISGIANAIPTNRIVNDGQYNVDGVWWRRLKVVLLASDVPNNLDNNINRTISFDLTSGGETIRFENKNLYFTNFNGPNVFTDISDLNNWAKDYIIKGANLGLFKGESMQSFNPSGNLQRQHAAKVIVEAAVRLRLMNINTSTQQYGTFPDVPTNHPFFIHIQTLRNYGYIVNTPGTLFNPTQSINIGQMCKILSNVFQVQSSDFAPTNYLTSLQRKIVPVSSDQSLIPFMSNILKLVDVKESSQGFYYAENIWDFLNFGNVTNSISGLIQVNGDVPITRVVMAKFMTNLVEWKAYKMQISTFAIGESSGNEFDILPFVTPPISEMISIGEKYDNAPISVNSTPTIINQQTYSVASGGSLTLSYNTSSLPQHYYWSMEKNGAILVSNNNSHSSVTFTAPSVSQPTQWKLYAYTANNKGKAVESAITINVGGSSGSSNVSHPSLQAHSLNVYNITQNSVTANWTRGNGQFCIVTMRENSIQSPDFPDNQIVYVGNQNFSQAPLVFQGSDTKVVYTGTGSSCQINGLDPNSTYQLYVMEYNSTSPISTFYNISNVPNAFFSTLNNISNSPNADFSWNENSVFQTGQTYQFNNTSLNANAFQWSITPSGSISNPTSSSSTNVSFLSSGQHTLSLIATNTLTGATSIRTHNFHVYNSNDFLPDFQPINLNFQSPIVAGQNLTITCNVLNNSPQSQTYTTHVTFVLSTDQTIDPNDYFLGQTSVTIGAGQNIPITHIASNIDNTFSGNFFILAKVDYSASNINGFWTESNETNNVISKPMVIQAALPDLIVQSFSPSSTILTSGQQFSVSGAFRNIGAGNAQSNVFADFYISNDNILSMDDIKINGFIQVSNNGLIFQANSPIVNASSNQVRIPFEIPNGNYFLICAVDYSRYGFGYEFDFNLESNEENNYLSTPITVSNPNQPTVNASGLSITNINNNSMTLNWVRGNGQGCIVLGCAYSDLPNKIIDGVSYIASNNFSSANGIQGYYTFDDGSFSIEQMNYVKYLYDGTGTSVNISGLIENETYSFIVLEYNGSGAQRDYLQISTIKGVSAHTDYQSTNNFRRIFGSLQNGTDVNAYAPRAIKFFNDNHGVLFKFENGIGRTTNGGLSWQFDHNTLIEKNKSVGLESSYWLENGFGWLGFSNGNLLNTTDYGVSWNEKTINRNILDIYFVNENVGYLALGSQLNSAFNDGAIFKTLNGGLSWTLVQNFPRPISSIHFLNENIGWATSYSTDFGSDKIFYKTNDGGQTWHSVTFSTTPPQSASLTDIFFTDANNGYAMTLFGWLIKTNNGGLTWTMENPFNILSNINSKSQIRFVNPQLGYVNIKNKSLAKTTNGGASWSVEEIPNSFNSGTIAELFVYNENVLYVSGLSGLLRSTTGGSPNQIQLSTSIQSLCQGQAFTLGYSITGQYGMNNYFSVELSDVNGNFSNPYLLGTFSNSGIGNLDLNIPYNAIAGQSYRLRIQSVNPNLTSNISDPFTISNLNPPTISISPESPIICPNQEISFVSQFNGAGINPALNWKKNGLDVGNSTTYLELNPINSDFIWLELVANDICANQFPVISNIASIHVIEVEDVFIQAIDNILSASTNVNVQWYRNGVAIEGATSQFYEASLLGFYYFTSEQNGCLVTSDIYQLEGFASVEDNGSSQIESITVFPNPFENTLRAISENEIITTLRVLDLQGKVIREFSPNNSEVLLDLGELSGGMYILEMETLSGMSRVSVVKR